MIAGGTGPAPDGSGNVTGVALSAIDERIPEGGCVAIYNVSPGVYSKRSISCCGRPRCATDAQPQHRAALWWCPLHCALACWHLQYVSWNDEGDQHRASFAQNLPLLPATAQLASAEARLAAG